MTEPDTQIRAVLWDLDGVLIDSELGYFTSVGDMVRSLGYPYGEEESAKVVGTSCKDFVRILALDEPPEKMQALYVNALVRSVRENVQGLIEGVAGFLDCFKARGIKMAIGSSSPKELVDFAVEKFSLSRWISVVVTGDDVESGKPSPEIYLSCAELLEVSPHECLVFEDSVNGMLAGKNAGMHVCAYTGTNRYSLDLSKADFAISEYTEKTLDEVVRRMQCAGFKIIVGQHQECSRFLSAPLFACNRYSD